MTDEKVEIIFTSDSSVQKGGFMIEWKFLEGLINLCFFDLKDLCLQLMYGNSSNLTQDPYSILDIFSSFFFLF